MARIIRQHLLRWCNRLLRCWLPARAVSKRLVVATLLNIFPTYFGAFASNIVQTSFVGRFSSFSFYALAVLIDFSSGDCRLAEPVCAAFTRWKIAFIRVGAAQPEGVAHNLLTFCIATPSSRAFIVFFILFLTWISDNYFQKLLFRSDCYFSRSDKETSCLRQEIVSSASWNINPFGGNNKAHKTYCLAEASTPALPGRERA